MLHPKDSSVHSDKFAWYALIAPHVTPSHRGGHSQENADNPNSDLESFDMIYFAALQVVIVSSANGVRI